MFQSRYKCIEDQLVCISYITPELLLYYSGYTYHHHKLAILIIFIYLFHHPHSISNYKSNLTPHLPTKIKAKSSYLPEEINNLTNYAAGLIVPPQYGHSQSEKS